MAVSLTKSSSFTVPRTAVKLAALTDEFGDDECPSAEDAGADEHRPRG